MRKRSLHLKHRQANKPSSAKSIPQADPHPHDSHGQGLRSHLGSLLISPSPPPASFLSCSFLNGLLSSFC
ncbi:rCG62112 [Rattus norvegicus]|uniref:RCG62112 n=1 Tax=Rattus norvegicus TaxID=10116 RepID=A6H9K4_RAT|nr:rCG62112 [Rattus norvegicus]